MNYNRIIIGSIVCLIWWVAEILSNPINENNNNMTEIVMMPFTINANPSFENSSSENPLRLIATTRKPLPSTTEKIIKILTTTQTAVIPTVVSFPKNHKPSFQPHTEPENIEIIRGNVEVRGKQQKWQIPSPVYLTTPEPKETNSSKRQIVMERFSEMEFVPSLEVGSYDNTEGFVPKIHQPKTLNFVQSLYESKEAKPSRHDKIFNPVGSVIAVKANNFQNKQSNSQQNPSLGNSNKQNGKASLKRIQNISSNKKFSHDSSSKIFPSAVGSRNPHNNRKKNNSNENRRNQNRRQGLMEEFQKDFGKLVGKYPELGDLIHGYPVMEEIMKQKLSEKFEKSTYKQKQYSEESSEEYGDEGDSSEESEDEGESEEENDDYKLKFTDHQELPFKFTNYKFQSDADANVNIYGNGPQTFDGTPYPFDGNKPSWPYKKKPDDVSPTIPAGRYYQNSKFPSITEHYPDKKPVEDENPINLEILERPPISPWKRAVHMLTAFLPVGLLISALTPSVININNTADQAFPIRQRSADWNRPATKLSNPLLEKLQGKFLDLDSLRLVKGTSENPVCDDWNFCEMAKRGAESDAIGMEKVFWQLAHEVPEHIAEKNGMKKLFKAIKSKDCSQFVCKTNHKPHADHNEEDSKNYKPGALLDLDVRDIDGKVQEAVPQKEDGSVSAKKLEVAKMAEDKNQTDALYIRVL